MPAERFHDWENPQSPPQEEHSSAHRRSLKELHTWTLMYLAQWHHAIHAFLGTSGHTKSHNKFIVIIRQWAHDLARPDEQETAAELRHDERISTDAFDRLSAIIPEWRPRSPPPSFLFPPRSRPISSRQPGRHPFLSAIPWPSTLSAQVTAIQKLLPTHGPDPEILAAQFGRKSAKRTQQVAEILETLQGLGKL